MKRICTVVCLLLVLSLLPVSAGAVTLEQAQPVMPVIDVYVHQNDLDLSGLTIADITAKLDEEALTVTSFAPSEQNVCYIFMLDVSGSIPGNTFRAACNMIEDIHSQLQPGDQLSVITFGEKVKTVVKGNETTAQVKKILKDIHATDQSTCFNEAMIELVKVASSRTNMRRVAVMISDAVEDPGKYPPSKTPQSDVEAALREGGVTVYGMAVDSRTGPLQRLQSFCELTGGKALHFHEYNTHEVFNTLFHSTDRIWHLSLMGKNNIADGELHKLSVQFGELSTLETEIRPTQWHPDTEAPTLLDYQVDHTAKTITLDVSEVLANAEDPASYLLCNVDEEQSNPETVEVDGTRITLHCPQLTEDPGWTLTTQGITDISMEANPLTVAIAITEVPVVTVPTDPPVVTEPAIVEPEEEFDSTLLIWLVAALGVLLVLILVLGLIRKKGGWKPNLNLNIKTPGKTAANSKKAREVSFYFEDADQK